MLVGLYKNVENIENSFAHISILNVHSNVVFRSN